MTHFVGLDVSVQETAVCVVDEVGKVICESKVQTEPDDIAALLSTIGGDYIRVGIEAGPLSQWLVNGLAEADLPVICVETRHMKGLLTAQHINKTGRNRRAFADDWAGDAPAIGNPSQDATQYGAPRSGKLMTWCVCGDGFLQSDAPDQYHAGP